MKIISYFLIILSLLILYFFTQYHKYGLEFRLDNLILPSILLFIAYRIYPKKIKPQSKDNELTEDELAKIREIKMNQDIDVNTDVN